MAIALVATLVVVLTRRSPLSKEVPIDSAKPGVSALASQTVHALEKLDVDAGLALLCRTPSSDQVAWVRKTLSQAQAASGNNNPGARYQVHNMVEGSAKGEFTLVITGSGKLSRSQLVLHFGVERTDDRFCLATFLTSPQNQRPWHHQEPAEPFWTVSDA